MYDALIIARYIIDKCFKEDIPVSNLRLQKLLYFIQLKSYQENNKPLFYNDIAAWQFGPVVPDVYYQYNVYAGTPILLRYNGLVIDKASKNIIDKVITALKHKPIWELVDITHKNGSPWDITVALEGLKAVISPKLIANEAKRFKW